MAKNNNPDQYDDDDQSLRDDVSSSPSFDGDLNFATDSTVNFNNSASQDSQPDPAEEPLEEPEAIDKTWVPTSPPTESGETNSGADDTQDATHDLDVDKTWVPTATPTVNGPAADQDNAAELDVGDTWVPDSGPQLSNADQPDNVDEKPDVDKTWVPTATPTQHGLDGAISAEANHAVPPDVGDTWVPESDSNARDSDTPIDEASADPDKTWVPAAAPTHHDFSFESAAEGSFDEGDDDDDPNKTWVPSKSPTIHGSDEEHDDAGSESPFEKTAVLNQDGDNVEEAAAGTVVMPRDEGAVASDSAVMETIVSDVDLDTDSTQIFSQTMGMRGLTEDEYDEWQEEVAEKSKSDTAVVEPPEEVDDVSDSTSGRRTQIWSKQSADGLDLSLTIRSRPVSGDATFEKGQQNDQPDYQIVEKLAEGGMGAIYIAKQTSLDRELAIKTLKPLRPNEIKSYTNQGRISQVQKQRREMFLSEALVTANLVHPHIIPIHDLCQTVDEAPFYSMKRVHGTPWNELIGDMPLEENLEVLHKVCDAMAYAHHNGVVNRDLKPENIMLGEFGEVLVLDWGLAVPASQSDKKRFASPSAAFGAGTPAYMSPELWAGPAEAIGPWSDIYLLGAILFEAITGKAPHKFPEPDSKSGNSGLWLIIDKVVRKNEIRRSKVTGELMDIATKAMATEPKQRHQSVLEFQAAISSFQKHEESRRLSERADATLNHAAETGRERSYQDFQTAAALFDEASHAWPENDRAQKGLRSTRLDYAALALKNGDFDLGLQVAAQEDGPEFTELSTKLSRSRRIRNGLKNATIAAAGIIVLVGAISFVQAVKIAQQNTQITSLYGDVESLEAQKGAAEEAKQQAVNDQALAEAARVEADQQRQLAMIDKAAAEIARKEAEAATTNAKMAQMVAEIAQQDADKDRVEAEKQAQLAKRQADEAVKQQMLALKARKEAEQQTVLAQRELKNVEKQKVRAGVDLQNAEIANLIRNADYASALRGVEDLLAALNDNNQDVAKLPEAERRQRIVELEARREQLRKRSIVSEVPVQTQVISPSGSYVVWGDIHGTLTVRQLSDHQVDQQPLATLKLNATASAIRISEDEQTILVAAGDTLHVWQPEHNRHDVLKAVGGRLTAIRQATDFVLTADDSGIIRSWDLNSLKERWSIRSSASIRDITLLNKANIFLYAGSRGGESADILAYQLPDASTPNARPKRLGQLKLPRNGSDPPLRMSLSPDEQLLMISNSRNGDVMALPRRNRSDEQQLDRFPFVHAADLAQSDDVSWLLKVHQRPVNDIVFSADGRRVATASDDRSVGIWELQADGHFSLLERLEGHGARVNAAGFLDTSGSQVLSASADRFCRFWNVDRYDHDREKLEATFNLSSLETKPASATPDVSAMDFVPAKRRWLMTRRLSDEPKEAVVSAAQPDYIVINGDRQLQRGALHSAVLSSDGSRLVTGAADGTAVIWDSATGESVTGVSNRTQFNPERKAFEEGHDFNVARLQFLPPDGRILLTTGFDGNLCLWNADRRKAGAGSQEIRIPGLGLVNAVATSTDGTMIATSVASSKNRQVGTSIVWHTDDLLNQSSPKPLAVLSGFHRADISSLSFHADGNRLVTGGRDGRVAVWDISTGERIAGGQPHAKNTIVSHLHWLPDNQILSAGFDGRLLVATVPLSASDGSLQVVAQFDHDRIPIERIACSPQDDRFVSISVRTDKKTRSTQYEIELWSLDQLTPIRTILPGIVGKQAARMVAAVHWSPNAKRLAAVVDGHLQVFSTETWKVQRVLEAPGLGISDAVFAPADDTADRDVATDDIIATFDGTAAHLWNLTSKSHIADFRPLFAVQSTALCDCLNQPLLVTGDRAIRIFQADSDNDAFGQTLFKIGEPHQGIVTSLEFSPHQKSGLFVSAGADGSAALWKWNPSLSQANLVSWLKKQGDAIVGTAWSHDGSSVLIADKGGLVQLIQADKDVNVIAEIQVEHREPVLLSAASFSSDSQFFAVSGQLAESGQSTAWIYQRTDAASAELHCTVTGHEAGGISCIRFVPDSPYLVTGGTDGAAMVWNWQPSRGAEETLQAYEAYQLLQDDQVVAHQAPINAITVSADGRIATASNDGTAVIWKNPFQHRTN